MPDRLLCLTLLHGWCDAGKNSNVNVIEVKKADEENRDAFFQDKKRRGQRMTEADKKRIKEGLEGKADGGESFFGVCWAWTVVKVEGRS